MNAEAIILIMLAGMAIGIFMGRHWDYFTSEE